MVPLLHFILATTSTAELQYTLTPCAENSFRVRIALTSPSAATVANQKALDSILTAEGLHELPGAFVCAPAKSVTLSASKQTAANGNLRATLSSDGSSISFVRVDTGGRYFDATPSLAEPPPLGASCADGELAAGNDLHVANLTIEEAEPRSCDRSAAGYLTAGLSMSAGDANELIYGLGQGEWSKKGGGCPEGPQEVVPLARNGQTINLLQTKFHVTIPTAFSSAGYALVFNMPGYGHVTLGAHGTGGMTWQATAALFLDFWVSGPRLTPAMAPHSARTQRPHTASLNARADSQAACAARVP